MSAVEIRSAKNATYPNLGRYFYAEVACGNHSAVIAVTPKHIQVIVQNASNRAWRGMGKQFKTLSDALAAYKTTEIRDMIQAAFDASGH